MATVNGTGEWIAPCVHRKTWANLAYVEVEPDVWEGDEGSWLDAAALADKTVHVFGTFGVGGSLSMYGRSGGTGDGKILVDALGAALTFSTEGLKQVLDNPMQIRPVITNGDDDTDLTVVVISHSPRV